jgi:hypothetical protein
MKSLMIACSVVALAATAGIASSTSAEASFLPGFNKLFGHVVGKQCHRVATHLPNPVYVWVCKQNSLPFWWSRNETIPTPSHSNHRQQNTPAPPPPPPPPEDDCEYQVPG